jgi:hypothetical protein
MGGLAVATSTLLISVYGSGGVKRAPDRTKRCAEPFVEVRQDGLIGTFLRMQQYLPQFIHPATAGKGGTAGAGGTNGTDGATGTDGPDGANGNDGADG